MSVDFKNAYSGHLTAPATIRKQNSRSGYGKMGKMAVDEARRGLCDEAC